MHACLNAEVNECDSRTALTYRLTLNRRFLYCVSSGAYILHMRIPTAGDPLFRPDASSSKFEIANPERSSDNFKSIGSRVFFAMHSLCFAAWKAACNRIWSSGCLLTACPSECLVLYINASRLTPGKIAANFNTLLWPSNDELVCSKSRLMLHWHCVVNQIYYVYHPRMWNPLKVQTVNCCACDHNDELRLVLQG